MSFLEELKLKRKKLASCDTIVTTATGERYREKVSTCEMEKIDDTSHKSYGFIVDTKPDFKPACILENLLYLGSQDAVTLENIQQYQFTHLLSIGIDCPLQDLPDNICLLYVPCLDLPDSDLRKDDIFQKSFDFIEAARLNNGCVLVHCNAGVSRSASVVLAYLMQYRNMDFQSAYQHVKTQRECIQPNAGFLKQLKEFTKIN